MSYYIAENGQQRGPYAPQELPAQGLRADTLVWAEGMGQWQRADHVPALRAVLASPAAAQPGAQAHSAADPYNAAPPYTGGPQYTQPYTPPPAGPYGGQAPYPGGGYPSGTHPVNGKKIAAAICGLLIGGFGVHKFILGYTGAGLVMLLVSVLTCGIGYTVMHVIGVIEGVIYLTKTDEQFYQEYVVQQKPWF